MTVAVIDVETTGLSPRTDRIVEVGVVLLDSRGDVEAEFETLVNPGRDVGPTGLHGIRAPGLTPMSSVSKQTAVLVCGDPHSQSGKASKARALGVRVISEAVFWESLSVAGSRS